jgi:hypothetical protein
MISAIASLATLVMMQQAGATIHPDAPVAKPPKAAS